MRYTAAILAALVAVGCNTPVEEKTTTEARLRNDPPVTCTDAQLQACPAPEIQACPDGSDPVIDYASDCCAHFSCQPSCQSAKVCERTPAPACPPNTKLWIGTALEDCCPAYRCEPVDDPGCGGKDIVCALALPYCGVGIEPVVVGQSEDCCPIYQCPCVASDDPTMPVDQSLCGCTYPVCMPGETLVCLGENVCGYPCECQPAHGMCASDLDCSADARCDLSACLLPPAIDAGPALCPEDACGPVPPTTPPQLCPDGKTMAGFTGRCLAQADGTCGWEFSSCPVVTECPAERCGPPLAMPTVLCPDGQASAGPTGRCVLAEAEGRCVWEVSRCPPPACEPADCGPEPMMPAVMCEDGVSFAGPTGRCLRDADGVCGWEIRECPPVPDCFGVCVPNVQSGCRADLECPYGQRCELSCTGWGCAPGPDGSMACACDLNDPSCYCDPATGECQGQTCEGRCVPVGPVCDLTDPNPAACTAIAPQCENGVQPVVVGTDPLTCCPIFKCPACEGSDQPIACPMPEIDCACIVSRGTDPATCCPVYECGPMDPATGECVEP